MHAIEERRVGHQRDQGIRRSDDLEDRDQPAGPEHDLSLRAGPDRLDEFEVCSKEAEGADDEPENPNVFKKYANNEPFPIHATFDDSQADKDSTKPGGIFTKHLYAEKKESSPSIGGKGLMHGPQVLVRTEFVEGGLESSRIHFHERADRPLAPRRATDQNIVRRLRRERLGQRCAVPYLPRRDTTVVSQQPTCDRNGFDWCRSPTSHWNSRMPAGSSPRPAFSGSREAATTSAPAATS